MVYSENEQLTLANKELEGATLLSDLLELKESAEHYRDIRLVHSFTSGKDIELKEQSAVEKIKNILSTLENIPNSIVNDRIVKNKIIAVKTKLAELNGNLSAIESGAASLYNLNHALVSSVEILFDTVLDVSAISSDKDMEISRYLKFIRNDIFSLNDTLGTARAIGAQGLTKAYADSDTLDLLDKLYFDLETIKGAFDGSYQNLKTQGKIFDTSGIDINEILDGTQFVKSYIDEEILNATSLSLSWHNYFDRITKEIQKHYVLSSNISQRITTRLEEKSAATNIRVMAISTAIASVIIISSYLYCGFYLSIQRGLKKLELSAERMAKGDMTVHIDHKSKDEMGNC